MKTPRLLIKLGGAALQEVLTLDTVAKAILNYKRLGHHVVLVHGGGPAINEELRTRGIDWTFVGGQRVTSAGMMDAIEYTLCGKVNPRVVRHLGAPSASEPSRMALGTSRRNCSVLRAVMGMSMRLSASPPASAEK